MHFVDFSVFEVQEDFTELCKQTLDLFCGLDIQAESIGPVLQIHPEKHPDLHVSLCTFAPVLLFTVRETKIQGYWENIYLKRVKYLIAQLRIHPILDHLMSEAKLNHSLTCGS